MSAFLPRTLRCAAPRAARISPFLSSSLKFSSLVRSPSTGLLTEVQKASAFGAAPRISWRRSSTAVRAFSQSSGFFTSAPSPAALNYNDSQTSSGAIPDTAELPPLSGPAVTKWLFASASLVFAIVIVGGVTRLTESGLSIVEWRPITGTLPPLSQAEWEEEFAKYQTSPEFKTMNKHITLDEFKKIFFWEYTHRLLGRVIGIAFVAPLTYFAFRRGALTAGSVPVLGALALLIGAQGALGWYMVKSGLRDEIVTNREVARVSHYRLAAHLSLALLLYIGMLTLGLRTRMDWKWANGGAWNGLQGAEPWKALGTVKAVRRFKGGAHGLATLVFLTAFSGAFVAGLDAGLIYNEFPTMGGGLAPPIGELMSPFYARKADLSDMWWRNIFENPTTVQFDHRVLAMTTYFSTTALYLSTLHPALKSALPLVTRRIALAAFGMVNLQVILGISTLLYLVPVPLAAAHQAGSVALLTTMVALMSSLGRPGRAAQLWRKARMGGQRVQKSASSFQPRQQQ